MISITGHLGSRVSALVDGQLPPAEEERAWSHVLGCPGCRRLVEREGWTKQQLRLLSCEPTAGGAPAGLTNTLYDVDAWSAVDAIERRSTRRRAGAVAVGGGAVGAAVLGLVALTGGLPGNSGPVRQAPATIRIQQTAPVGSPTGAQTGVTADLSQGWARRSR